MPKNLIIYYSRRGENYFGGEIRVIEKGNTEQVAQFIQAAVGGDLFEVETVKPYPPAYKACIEQAKHELCDEARPALKKYISDISEYDNIFICGPCWWGRFPMAVFSLLEKLDFTGKKVMGLMTHEGSGLGNTERDLKKFCPGATFGQALAVHGSYVKNSQEMVTAWAKEQIG
ncbi:MAG: NAD(P)H-dependent oxidoreductase [Elusimicrobiaceae bacterium]|nr:NAD(P)H-dependent oxidoreductase [Elusimicrobiaceae bacterium]